MNISAIVTDQPRRRFGRVVAGLALVAVLGAACGQGDTDSTAEASLNAQPSAPTLDHASLGHSEALGQAAGSATDGAAELRQTLTAVLQEHEYLAGIAVAQAVITKKTDSPEFTAAAAALDKNSVALAEAVNSIYPGTKDVFLASWRKHIGFFVDYTVGKLTNDAAKATKAKTDLDGYRADFGALLSSVNPNLPKDAVAEALIPHVTATFAAIDGVVAGDGTGFEKLRVAAGHMPMLATTLAGAITKQFPDKFPTAGSAAADTGTAGLPRTN